MKEKKYDDEKRGALWFNPYFIKGSNKPQFKGHIYYNGQKLDLVLWENKKSKVSHPDFRISVEDQTDREKTDYMKRMPSPDEFKKKELADRQATENNREDELPF